MKSKIKFGFSTLLAMAISMNFALAQQSKPAEKPNASPEYQTLKKDWDTFHLKAEANAVDPAQKPALAKEYNDLVERLESLGEGIKPAKAPVKVATSTTPGDKPKKEQVSAMK